MPHTTGPWTQGPNILGAEGCEIRGRANELIADLYDAGDGTSRIPNARLIAAAPELLAALKDTQETIHGEFCGSEHNALCTRYDALIAKAEGR